MVRLMTLAMLFLALGFGLVLTRLGLHPLVVAPAAVFGVALPTFALSILIGVDDAVPLLAGGMVFGGLAVLLLVFDHSHGYDWVTALELLAAVGAVELAVILGGRTVQRLAARRTR